MNPKPARPTSRLGASTNAPRPPTKGTEQQRPLRASTTTRPIGTTSTSRPQSRPTGAKSEPSSKAQPVPPRPAAATSVRTHATTTPLSTGTELYTSLYLLSTLRTSSQASTTAYTLTTQTLVEKIKQSHSEVGKAKERCDVEQEVEVLQELCSEGMEKVVEVLKAAEKEVRGSEKVVGGMENDESVIYTSQLRLSESHAELLSLLSPSAATPPLSATLHGFLLSLAKLVSIRLETLARTRLSLERKRVAEMDAVRMRFSNLLKAA